MIDVPREVVGSGRPEGWKRSVADGGLAISRSSTAEAAAAAAMARGPQQAGLDRQPGQNRGVWHEQPRATSSSMRRPET